MMRFYVINRKGSNQTTRELLKNSSEEKGLEFFEVLSDEINFTSLPQLNKGDFLYNLCLDEKSRTLEKCLINNVTTTLYQNNNYASHSFDNVIEASIIHRKSNLPIIETIFDLTRDRGKLMDYVNNLNGFPLIIKSTGGSHGVGVIKVDSFDSLLSIVDSIYDKQRQFILREFIDYTQHARLIVLGNKVISSIEYKKIANDFRSNVGHELNVVGKSFTKEIEDTAIKSVQVLGFEFGGVDILIDKHGNHFIAEVNFPCFFPRAQKATGTDISGMMVDYLINKSK